MAKSNKTFPNKNALSKLAIAIFCANSGMALAITEGGTIADGNGSAEILGVGTAETTIDQFSDTVTIDWTSFDIGINDKVIFNQAVTDIAINRIGSATASKIEGQIIADGTVFLQNTNGFIFGATSSINTGAFLATTSQIIDNTDYKTSDYTDSIKLEDADSTGAISIHKDASINANNQASGGYLAFISKDISFDSGSNEDNSNSGLHAENGEVLISNDVDSRIKLAGLNINFPASMLTGSDENKIDITNANISAETVIISSNNLTDLLDSVVSQPASISAGDLIISADTLGNGVSQGIYDAVDSFSTVNNHLAIGQLTLEDRSPTGHIELSKSLSLQSGVDLSLSANSISLINGNISGNESDLKLTASNVEIGYFQNNFGGNSKLGSLFIESDSTVIRGSIQTENNITINGDTEIIRDSPDDIALNGFVTTKLWSENGSISFNGNLIFTGGLYLRAGGDEGITLGETSGFSEIDLNASQLNIFGDITTTDSFSVNNISDELQTNVKINQDSTIESSNISFEDFYFSSSNPDNELSFHITNSGSLSLKKSSINIDTQSNALNSIKIGTDNPNTNIIISGDFESSEFIIEGENNLSLAGDTQFTGISNFDLSNTELSGDYLLSLNGTGTGPKATFDNIESVNGIKLVDFQNATFNGVISTNEGGLSVDATQIMLEAGGDILIENTDGGEITLLGNITTSDASTGLEIHTNNGDIKLGSINNFETLRLRKDLADEGDAELNGDISIANTISFENIGDIKVNNDISMSASDMITLSNSKLLGSNNDTHRDISLTSDKIDIDKITGKNIDINTSNLTLSNDITAASNLSVLSSNPSDTVSITLMDDITLTGYIDFLSTSDSKVNFKRADEATPIQNKNLSIISRNDIINLHTFDSDSQLSSLSVTTASTEAPVQVLFNTVEGNIVLPTLTSTQGFSLLGNMYLETGIDQTFDTSGYGGNLNFSGVSITGSGELGFNTGTGELSLGDIGTNNPDDLVFTNLKIDSTGKLNLHGDLNIALEDGKSFDFSSLNTIELHTDLTLGNSETLVGVNFGSASINGTHDLTIYTNNLTLGEIGNNIALQDLNIFNDSEITLSLDNNISVVGDINITSNSLVLDNVISNTGLDVKIETEGDLIMSDQSVINASSNNISLISNTGNIGIGQLIAAKDVTVRSEQGYLYNSIDNYISNESTGTNIISENQYLYGLTSIGKSVASPIVINAQNGGTIYAESNGSIYIANLANANVNATGRVIDGSIGGETATLDAFTQFKLSSLNTTNLPMLSSNLGLISNSTWQVDEEESIRKIKSPVSAPSIYYSRNGWRLGQK